MVLIVLCINVTITVVNCILIVSNVLYVKKYHFGIIFRTIL